MTRSGHAYTPQKTRDAEEAMQMLFRSAYRSLPFGGPVEVDLLFLFAKPKSNKSAYHTQRPDADNLAKTVTDAMNGIVYKDDSQIVSIRARKEWAVDGESRIVVKVRPV